ncbi:MAG: iron chelate uptake ABC transporter family permease subunit [Lachnospirales bacterium]
MSEIAKRNVQIFDDEKRFTKAFRSNKELRNYWILVIVILILGLVASFGLLVYNNPVPVTSSSFIPVVKRRIVAVTAMAIAVVCQSLSTVAFHSVTNNRIITPSLLGFDSLYVTINTSVMFFFGSRAFIEFTGTYVFLFQVVLMVLMCLFLYGWLLSGKYGDLQLMLLVGIIMGTGMKSISSFMRRMLAPSEFDVLQTRMFASVTNADVDYFPIAIPIVLIAGIYILVLSNRLNVLSLGKDVSTALGNKHKRYTIIMLVLVSILMAVSTALIGPLTFFGFLVATLSYQLVPSYDHKYIFPMALVIGFLIMTGSYFIMYHIFNAQGVVSIIIEMFGGVTFLVLILRKGSL